MQLINRILKREYARWKNRGRLIIHRGAYTDDITFYEGKNILYPKANVEKSFLGYATYIAVNADIAFTKIGRYSCIGPNVKIIRGQHPISFVSIHPAFYSLEKQSGFTYVHKKKFEEFRYADEKYLVSIGNDVWIGDSVKIMEGIRIGDGAIIAAGALVTKNVEPYAIVGGVPAKIINKRFTKDIVEKLLKLSWWNKDENWIKSHAELFDNVEALLDEAEDGEVL